MPLVFGVLVDVFLREAAEKDAVQAGVESVEVGAAHVTNARLGLEKWWETMGLGVERSGDLGGFFLREIRRIQTSDIWVIGTDRESGTPCRLN